MDNQQYKWRQRKKRNLYITVWICLVILFSILVTFAYEGTRAGDPLAVAKEYIKDTTGAEVSKCGQSVCAGIHFDLHSGWQGSTAEDEYGSAEQKEIRSV